MNRSLIALLAVLNCARAFAAAPPQLPPTTGPSKVAFDEDGILKVNGDRFFPIGIYLYDLNGNVMADLHEHRFNTVIGSGFNADQFDFLKAHGMMAVPFSTPEFVQKVKDHPSLLAWYLVDEPEGHDHTPASVKEAYDHLKAKDANHPIGQCHFLFDAAAKFKEGSDFSLTDVYPVTANRDVPLANVGIHMDQERKVHSPGWPVIAYIQDFGGPETEGGKWAQPLPHEVRCMAFVALVHRSSGILYFSYWPKAPLTWASITELNRDIERIVPWLIAREGKEIAAKSSDGAVQVRARRVGQSTMVIAVNTTAKSVDAGMLIEGLGNATLRLPYENREMRVSRSEIHERFSPFEAKVFLSGEEPQ